MKVLVQGGFVVGFNGREHEVIRDGVVVFEKGQIIFVGKEYSDPVDKRIEAKGCLISPGFIGAHFHSSSSNAGDYLLNEPDKTDFFASNYLSHNAPLKGKTRSGRRENVARGVRFSLLHNLKSGATTTIAAGIPGGKPEEFVEMVGEVGVRCYTGLSYDSAKCYFDREGRLEHEWNEERGREGLKKAVAFAKKFNGACNGRIGTMLFPSHADACTLELLKESRESARELGVRIQTHAAINLIEFHTIMRRYRCTPVELLNKIDFLDPEVSLAHCIFLTGYSWTAYPYGDDLKIIADSGASVIHCPLKYLKIGIVMESFDRYRRAGINVALGTDTFPKDIISEMRYAALASRLAEKSFIAGHPRDVFNAATLGGAKLLGRDDLGRLQKGARADIVVIDLKDISFGAIRDPIKALVETGTSRDVRTVIVDGEILVDERRCLGVNEEELVEEVQAIAEEEWSTMPEWHWTGKGVDEVMPPAFKLI